MELLDDEELRAEADALRERARDGESLDDLLPEAFAPDPRGFAPRASASATSTSS